VPAENLGKFALEEIEEYELKAEYEDHVYVEGLGTRLCKIYEFCQTESDLGNMKITVYSDPEIELPLKITFDMEIENNQNINFDINLKDTNIPQLK
jgi:hypothetical protein